MKKIYKIGLIVICAFYISSCVKEPNYPITPAISFNSFVIHSDSSATLQINFTDGDGDIGYPPDDASAPVDCYLEMTRDSANNGRYLPYIINGGTPDPIMGDTIYLPYHIPYITPVGKYKALSGQIQIALEGNSWYPQPHVSAKFIVWIIDRAGHISNRVTTPAFVTP